MSVQEIYDRRPSWVSTGIITFEEAQIIDGLIREERPRFLVEIGTASGVSTAVIACAASATQSDWQLHAVDMMEQVYFDSSKAVGQAAIEMFGPEPRICFHRSATAFDMKRILQGDVVDFAFIDASHASPWAAVDLLSILASLRRGAIVAFHDLKLPFRDGYAHQNAPRDLFRLWRGHKWVDPRAPNLGMIRFSDLGQALDDIAICLQADWDVPHDESFIENLARMDWKFDGVFFPNRTRCQQFLSECHPEVINGNEFVQPVRYPFAKGSALHPNVDGSDASVIWRNLPVFGANRIEFLAFAHNQAAENPGAEITLSDLRDPARSETVVMVEPRRQTLVSHELGGRILADMMICIRARAGRAGAFAGVQISRFALGCR